MRPGVPQPGEPLGQEQPGEVRRVLLEREAILVAPHEAHELVADQAEGLDGDPALAADEYPVLEGLADVVVGRRAARVDDAEGERGALPR